MADSIFKDKTLLITGGTGSFGHTVLKHFLSTDIGEIRIFSRDEKKQDDMRHELQANHPQYAGKVKFYIGDVRNPQSIRDAMPGVNYIFHAAALKQVPSCEFFPMQAVQTNIIGTDNVLHAAIDAGVERVVCLSTDKAAYPINAMGISKAMMEHVIYANARVAAERGGELRQAGADGREIERLADHARGRDDDVLRRDVQRGCCERAHLLRDGDAVGVAGVGVAAVADDSLCLAVGKMLLRHDERRALDQIRGVDCGRAGRNAGIDQRQIPLRFILPDAAVDARGRKALRGAHAAFDRFHLFFLPHYSSRPSVFSAPVTRFIHSTAAPDAPLPRLS